MSLSDLNKPFINNQLASQPNQPPRFFVSLTNSKGQNFKVADPCATRALIACMNMEAGLKGAASHWGGPAAFAEIMSALHALLFDKANKLSVNWSELFHVINDAGHCENGLYALKANYKMAGLDIEDLKHFRSLKSSLTGHGEVHLFPKGVYLSNGPLASTLAQTQGLAMADKLLANKRVSISIISDGACMEGEAKEALSAIPGFYRKNKLNPFLLLISDNNTKLTGRIDEDSFSMEPYLQSLVTQGWDCSFISKGNDLKTVFHSLEEALEKLEQKPKKPLALIFKTCKGFGVKSTMDDSSGGHGFPLKNPEDLPSFLQEIYGSNTIPQEISSWCHNIQANCKAQAQKTYIHKAPSQKTQVGISKALIELKQKGLPIVSISSDLYGSTGVKPFIKKFPKFSFDVGVAESNMISTAIGFSKQGFIPVVDTFAQFAVTKGALPLIMSALSQAPVIGIFSHTGFQDAADGASHQALSYFANTCSLPHTTVYALSCAEEAYHLLSQAIEKFWKQKASGQIPKSQIFFLGRENFPESFSAPSYDLNKAQVLFENLTAASPVLIVSSGPLVQEALTAAKALKDRGAIVINNPCVSDPDIKQIAEKLKLCEGRLLTVEDHQIKGGMSSILITALKEQGCDISKFKALALRGTFGRSAYKAADLYHHFGLDSEAIVKSVIEI